jgi:hypothetical protein
MPLKAWSKNRIFGAVDKIRKSFKKLGCKLHDDHHIALALVGADPKCQEIYNEYQTKIKAVLANKSIP